MSLTVSPNLTQIFDGSSATNWTSNRGPSTSNEVYVQGTSAISVIVPKNTNDTILYDYYSDNGNTTFDISATDTHIYVWLKCDIAPFIDYVHIGVRSNTADGGSTTGDKAWTVVDNTGTSLEWGGEWKCFIVDVNDTNTFTNTGTLDYSGIGWFYIVIDNSNSGNIRSIENTYIDVARFGTGITAYGDDFDFGDIEGEDQNVSNMYGIIQEIDGVYFIQGSITITDTGSASYFNSQNETLAFRDRSVSSGLYKLEWSGSLLTSSIDTLSVLSSGIDDNTRPDIYCISSSLNLSMIGAVFNRCGEVTFNTSQSVETSIFNNCGTIYPSGSLFTGNKISKAFDSSSLIMIDGHSISNCTFIANSGSDGHAIRIDSFSSDTASFSSLYFTDYGSNETSSSALFNNTNDSLLIVIDGGDTPTYRNSVGSSTTVSNPISVTFTDIVSGSEVRLYESGSAPWTQLGGEESVLSSFTYNYNYTSDINAFLIVHALNYSWFKLELTLTNSNTTIPISQQLDRNYNNP